MRILIVDCNIEKPFWGAHDLIRYARCMPDATVYVRRAPPRDLPATCKLYDRVIISGSLASISDSSPWVMDLLKFTNQIIEKNIPLLGVCFGHQIIIRAMGGPSFVGKAEHSEFGWTDIRIVHDSALLKGLPSRIVSFSSHNDAVLDLTPEAVLLASSRECRVQAYQIGNKPIFGIQFHPERDLEGAEITYHEQKEKGLEKNVMRYKEGKKFYNPLVGELIFKNFLNLGSA